MEYALDIELSDQELVSIGKIVALWGSLEHEIFCQTLMCFSTLPQNKLPKEMNNMNFSGVLELWESRVVNSAADKRREVLQKQLKGIRHYQEFRNAIVHGMWDWSITSPERITASRILKKEIINVHFTADDLASFASDLETMNFWVRYPGGPEEFATALAEKGSLISRRAFRMMVSKPTREPTRL